MLEVGLLPVARVDLFDLPELPTQEVLALGAAALLRRRRVQLARDLCQRVHVLGHTRTVGLEVTERVEILHCVQSPGRST